jgi:hypothetical protein
VTIEMRELRTLEDAVALLDEWLEAYRELERQHVRLDHAWRKMCHERDMDNHALYAQLCDRWLAEAEASAVPEVVEEENPFA